MRIQDIYRDETLPGWRAEMDVQPHHFLHPSRVVCTKRDGEPWAVESIDGIRIEAFVAWDSPALALLNGALPGVTPAERRGLIG